MSRLLVLQFNAFSGLISKKVFLLSFLAKNYHPVVIFGQAAGFWHQQLGQKFKKINFNFFKTLLIFYHSRALLATYMTDWTLQKINNSIGLTVKSLSKIFSHIFRNSCDPHFLSMVDNFYHAGHMSQVNFFREKVKNHEKNAKNHDFYARYTPICV